MKPTVLIVDDMEENLMLLNDILEEKYTIKIAKSGQKALDIVQKGGVDLILLDVVMPGMDGYEVCKTLQNDKKTEDIPIIFVTGNTSVRDEKKGFELGAVDYITKPFNLVTVRARVKTHMNLHLKQLELEKYIAMIEKISITDGLTSLYNRRHFNEIFPKVINSAKRKDELICFLLLDIDHFKPYNDHYGHQAGDEALMKFASSLKSNLKRADDMAFRLGGEEFGIVYKSDTQQKAYQFANKVRQNIEDLQIVHEYNSASGFLTASMGLLCKKATQIKDMDEAFKQADDLLYEAKENGRNQVKMNNEE